MELNDEFVAAVKLWLREHIPEFAEFQIAASGKYLGWHLGVDSATLSFHDPLAKFNKRVLEIADGKAPSTVAFLRYNERAVSVLSYVAQFAIPPSDLGKLEYQARHKLLRMPPQSMSYDLSHRLEDFCGVAPTALEDYCLAVMYRFAHSERKYLAELSLKVQSLIGDSFPIDSFGRLVVPDGELHSLPILQSLFNALDLSSCHANVLKSAHVVANTPLDSEEAMWLTNPTIVSSYNFGIKHILVPEVVPPKLQGTILKIFKIARDQQSLSTLLASKARITLTPEVASTIVMNRCWFEDLLPVLHSCKILLRVCWLKAITGAWTTSIRMHDGPPWPCIFGCLDARDEFNHYMLCPILWQLVREQIGPVDTISVGDRLCLSAACPPSRQLLRQLALAHLTYHSCRKDKVIITLMNDLAEFKVNNASSSSCSDYSSCSSSSSSSEVNHQPWPIVQSRALGFCRAGSSLI